MLTRLFTFAVSLLLIGASAPATFDAAVRQKSRWIAGIVVGIAMAALVWWVLDSHLKAAHHRTPGPQSPVIIDIVPGK